MSEANFQTASEMLHSWRDAVLSGKLPDLYPVGVGDLKRIEIGPGLVTLIGGAPGAGKTAFVMQCVIDALRETPTLRAVACNIEMPPGVLLDRQLARLSGIALTTIRHRQLGPEHQDRIETAMATLESIADRLAFVRSPCNLENVAATVDAFITPVGGGLIVLDYIQRIPPPGAHGDKRGSVDASMDFLRKFADNGDAIIAVSAVGRSKDARGRSSYSEGLSLASFRESSELEFGADDAFILLPDMDADGNLLGSVVLRHLKSRHGECRDISLTFDRQLQRFVAATSETAPATKRPSKPTPPKPSINKLQVELASLWDSTTPTVDEEDSL